MDFGEPVSEQQQLPDEALETMLLKREPIPPSELSRAVGLMTEQILRFRRERNIAAEPDLEEPIEIQIGRDSRRLEQRDQIGSYPSRINLEVDRGSGISREHLQLQLADKGITVVDSSVNGTYIDDQQVHHGSFSITDESDHQIRLGPKAPAFVLNLATYRTAVTTAKNDLRARRAQPMPTIE